MEGTKGPTPQSKRAVTDHVMKLPPCLLNRGEIGNVREAPNEGKWGEGERRGGRSDLNARPREIQELMAARLCKTNGGRHT